MTTITTPLASAPSYTAPEADGYRGIWYCVRTGAGSGPDPWRQNKYGGAMATYPQQHAPIALRRTDPSAGIDRTYFVYGGFNGDAGRTPNMIGYFDHASGLLARPRTIITRSVLDAHENPTLAITEDGHLIVFSPAHGAKRKAVISRTTRPWAIDQWQRIAELPAGDTTFSYPQPHVVPGQGLILLHTHYRSGGNRTLYWNTSTDGGCTWDHSWDVGAPSGARPKLAAMEGGQYQTSWRFGQTVATAFNMHPSDSPGMPLDYRTNLYFARTSDLGRTWQAGDGTDLTADLPLIDPDNAALVAEYRRQGLNVYLKDVQQDADGNPLLLYLTSGGPEAGPDNGPHTLRTARLDGGTGRWELRDVLVTDHNYDHGSLLIERTRDGGQRWRLLGPFLDAAQPYATGGNMGLWESTDLGENWELVRTLTRDNRRNHSYFRRVENCSDAFIGLWSAGHAWEPGEVSLYFADSSGRVFRMPEQFEAGEAFAAPIEC